MHGLPSSVLPSLVAAISIGLACALDRIAAARGLLPPGFREPWRRVAAFCLVAVFLMVVFLPLAAFGEKTAEPAPTEIATPQLFLLHVLMVITMGGWLLLGFAGEAAQPSPPPQPVPPAPEPEFAAAPLPPPSPPRVPLGRQLAAQLGYLAPSIPREIGLGLLLGLGAWAAVILALLVIAGVLYATGGERILPEAPPAVIPLIAGLPFLTRLLVSLSAGVVEESFFRGFLQPRMGIVLSTVCFAVPHLSYGSPFLLVGVTLLSLIYAFLVKWRQSIWAAMAAHALFDGVQLLVIVPMAIRFLGAGKGAAFLW
jgi:membrane protease YdiL (CAAX protease family)